MEHPFHACPCRLLRYAHLQTQQQAVGEQSSSSAVSHGGTMQSLLTQSCCQHTFSPNMSRHEDPVKAPAATRKSDTRRQLQTTQDWSRNSRHSSNSATPHAKHTPLHTHTRPTPSATNQTNSRPLEQCCCPLSNTATATHTATGPCPAAHELHLWQC